MKRDLLKLIKEQQDVTNAVVLTHNLDFIYLQNLLLPALRRCGSPSLTVFADARSAAETFAYQAPLLSNLGRRYRVVPVAMEAGFRFHPKALFLSGRKKSVLLVGSGNLTFAGWRENAEIWAAYDSDEGTAEIAGFRSYLLQLVERLVLNDSLRGEIEECFDPSTRVWASSLDEPSGLVGRLGKGTALIEDLLKQIGPEPVDRLIVSAPYFDADCVALQQWISALDPAETLVSTDPDFTNLRPENLEAPPPGARFRPVTVRRTTDTGSERRCFVHAKFYAVEQGDVVTLFVGSANCSRAALTVAGERGNAELMAVRRLTVEELGTEVLEEIEIGENPLELPPESSSEQDEKIDEVRPRLLAARDQGGLLKIAFEAPTGWLPRHAVIDDTVQDLRQTAPGRCECISLSSRRFVHLQGLLDGQVVESSALWIDHEEILASSAYRRSFQASVRSKAWKSDWEVGDWGEILEVFCRDLEYISPRRAIAADRKNREQESPDKIFTREDLFARNVGMSLARSGLSIGTRRITVPSLLLQWFGNSTEEETADDSMARKEMRSPSGEEEPVDQPEDLRLMTQTPEEVVRQAKKEERVDKKARRIVDHLAATMSSIRYLESRQPEHLAMDLKIAFLLLRMGLSKGWIDRDHFLLVTFRIWGKLFLADGEESSRGWLEDHGTSFHGLKEAMAPPDLTAVLFAWSLEIPDQPTTARETQLLLALALSVSRHAWLWLSSDLSGVASSLASLLKATANSYDEKALEARWAELMELGRALHGLESAIRKLALQDLLLRNRQQQICRGEIVFQGAWGFCVVQESADRSGGANVPLLTLHGEDQQTKSFKARCLNPLAGLLETNDVIPENRIEPQDLDALRRFIDKLRAGLIASSAKM